MIPMPSPSYEWKMVFPGTFFQGIIMTARMFVGFFLVVSILSSAGAVAQAGDVKERATLEAHRGGVRWIAFSPNSKLLASVGFQTVKLWDVVAGDHVATLEGQKEYF